MRSSPKVLKILQERKKSEPEATRRGFACPKLQRDSATVNGDWRLPPIKVLRHSRCKSIDFCSKVCETLSKDLVNHVQHLHQWAILLGLHEWIS